MGKRNLKLPFFVVLVGLAAFAWFLFSERQADVAPAASARIEVVPAKMQEPDVPRLLSSLPIHRKEQRAPARATPAPLPSLPAASRPDLLISIMTPYAERGEVEAMRLLAHGLHECARVDRGNDAMLENKSIEGLARLEETLRVSGQEFDPAQHARQAQEELQFLKALRDACAQIDEFEANRWPTWLERAAHAGDVAAMHAYIEWTWEDILRRTRYDLRGLEQSARQRDTAFHLAGELLAGGDCSVMRYLQNYAPDPVQAYTYALATYELARVSAMAAGVPENAADMLQAMDSGNALLGARLSSSRLDEARRAASYLVENYCGI